MFYAEKRKRVGKSVENLVVDIFWEYKMKISSVKLTFPLGI